MPREKSDKTEVLSERVQRPIVLKKVRLVVLKGKDEGRDVLIQKPEISIGARPDNDLVLSDPTVSRNHAVVMELADGYLLRDLNSTNGTFLDGVRIKEGYLRPGSVIRIGQTEIAFSPIEERLERLMSASNNFGGLFGDSPAMREIFGILERVSMTDATVLLLGETGTGKELAARAIHDNSRRADRPFVVFDCGAAAPNLIESELFGHERGAFTDAVKSRQGAFELADGGTIFLDEIGELSPELQPKLLRVLDRREVKRVGAEQAVSVDVRVVAATNRDLEKEVKAGNFREDLFYRLSVVTVFMPPLRKRREDIRPVAERLLSDISADINKRVRGISAEALEALLAYHWPGNVRELKNVLERAAALCEGDVIGPRDLFLSHGRKSATLDTLSGKTLEEIEKAAIQATLRSVSGNKTKAANILGIAYSTLYEKMKKFGIKG